MKKTLFLTPASDGDLPFVMRCLWALDPDRDVFAGDFRDYARAVVEKMLPTLGSLPGIPSICVDEIARLARETPCCTPTRRCWQQIAERMRGRLETVRIMRLAPDDITALRDFVRGSFQHLGGKYYDNEENLPRELLAARGRGLNGALEAIAGELRRHLDPDTVAGAILLWTLWCLETRWPECKAAGHYRTPFSLGWQLAREQGGPRDDPDRWGAERLVSMGADLKVAADLAKWQRPRLSPSQPSLKVLLAIRRAVYALDPNRHLAADIPFQQYFLSVIKRAVGGIAVPEASINLFGFYARSDYGPARLDASWADLAGRMARMVRSFSESPQPCTVGEDEAWRKKIFTYPPGSYAILKCGPRLGGLAAAEPISPAQLVAWAESFRGGPNPFDCLAARTLRHAWDFPDE